jgi:UDP-glucose 4-epimerase
MTYMIYEDSFKEERVLITGGLGFIGSNLARALVQHGANVTLIDILIPQYGGNMFSIDEMRSSSTGADCGTMENLLAASILSLA